MDVYSRLKSIVIASMAARAFLSATDENVELCILCRDPFKNPRSQDIQTVRDDSWSNLVSIGEQ